MKWVWLIILAGIIVYFNILFNGFVWDDEEQIVKNTTIYSIRNIGAAWSSGTFNTGGAGMAGYFYRPMMTTYFMLLYQIFELNAWGYHLAQIILHIVNALLLFKLLKKFVEEKWAGLGGLIFVVHAGISKAVVYIASVGDVLYTMFGLIVLLNSGNPWIVGGGIFLALLCKESAISIVPILWIKERKLLPIMASVLGVATYLILRLAIVGLGVPKLDLSVISEASLGQRIMTIPSEIGNYLRLFFWPARLSVSQHWVVREISDIRFWGFLVLIIIIGGLVIWGARKSKNIWFFVAWSVIGLGVVSNIFPLDWTIDETWFYFISIGFIGVLVGILSRVKWAWWTIILLLVPLGLRTIWRNKDWRDGITLYSHDVKISPPSFELENNIGVELVRAGRYDEAKGHFERSIELQPRWWFTYNNLGAVYHRKGDLEKAREYYEKTLQVSDYYLAYENLAFVKLKLDKPEETEKWLEIAIGKLPNNDTLRMVMALTKYRLGKYEEAVLFAKQAYAISASERNGYVLRGILNKEELVF